MKKLLFIASILTVSLIATISFAHNKMPSKMTKPTLTKMNTTGDLKWTGFGVGKSHTGTVTLKSGTIEMKGTELVGGIFVLDMTTLKTSDSPKLEGHLKSADFFDVEKFTEGTFKITKVEVIKGSKAGEPTHKITGDLTIKGKTHTEMLLATVNQDEKGIAATAETEIKDRTQYDIVYNSAKFKAVSALGDKLIQDNIKVQLNIKTN
ncbi:MAG: YceI family protein [Bdellovibrionota bacterium]